MQRSFGPAAIATKGEPLKVSCCTRATYCFQLYGKTCRDQKPPREIPDPRDTPEWCKYRAGIERDVSDDHELRALGLLSKPRAELVAMVKALPVEARGRCTVNKRPWKLPEMNADMLRHALLRAHREAAHKEDDPDA